MSLSKADTRVFPNFFTTVLGLNVFLGTEYLRWHLRPFSLDDTLTESFGQIFLLESESMYCDILLLESVLIPLCLSSLVLYLQ